MLSDSDIDEIFMANDYVRTGKLQYKSNYSNEDIYHFVEMNRSIKNRENLGGQVRVGNKDIALLCQDIWFGYLHRPQEFYSEEGIDAVSEIFLNIDIDSKYIYGGSLTAVDKEFVSSFLNEMITPLFPPIYNLETLLHVTIDDVTNPIGWNKSNSGIRATQALIIAKRISIEFLEITSKIDEKFKGIEDWTDIEDTVTYFKDVWIKA